MYGRINIVSISNTKIFTTIIIKDSINLLKIKTKV